MGLDGKFHLGELNIGFANLQIALFVISSGTPVYLPGNKAASCCLLLDFLIHHRVIYEYLIQRV